MYYTWRHNKVSSPALRNVLFAALVVLIAFYLLRFVLFVLCQFIPGTVWKCVVEVSQHAFFFNQPKLLWNLAKSNQNNLQEQIPLEICEKSMFLCNLMNFLFNADKATTKSNLLFTVFPQIVPRVLLVTDSSLRSVSWFPTCCVNYRTDTRSYPCSVFPLAFISDSLIFAHINHTPDLFERSRFCLSAFVWRHVVLLSLLPCLTCMRMKLVKNTWLV